MHKHSTGDIYLSPSSSPSHWHVHINFCCVSRRIVFKVNLICPWYTVPPPHHVSILNGLPQGSACVCSESRPSGHVVNLLERLKKKCFCELCRSAAGRALSLAACGWGDLSSRQTSVGYLDIKKFDVYRETAVRKMGELKWRWSDQLGGTVMGNCMVGFPKTNKRNWLGGYGLTKAS